MNKVLIVVSELNRGGVANAVLNFYRACNNFSSSIIYDFVLIEKPNENILAELKLHGSQVYYIDRMANIGIRKYIKTLTDIIENHGTYIAVHCHLGDKNWIGCKAAKKAGIKNIIAHAHGSVGQNWKHTLITKMFFSTLNRRYSTKRFACSMRSGVYTFKKDFELLPNVISNDSIKLNKQKDYYTDLNLSRNVKIIGYLGVFENQKNAEYLIKIMSKYQNKYVVCIFAGDGALFNDVKIKAKGFNNIIFLGYRNDPNELLRFFDVLVMPSLSEGMSMSLLQAQLIGTPCVVSKGVPDTNDLQFGLFTKVDDFNVENWVAAINKSLNQEQNKDDYSINERYNRLKEIGYDAETIADRLYKSYTLNN